MIHNAQTAVDEARVRNTVSAAEACGIRLHQRAVYTNCKQYDEDDDDKHE